MNSRYSIISAYICPFIFLDDINIVPNFADYPIRECVLDREKKIIIDIETEQQYDYLETVSRLFVLIEYREKIKDQKRVGIYSLPNFKSNNMMKKGENIIKRLKKGEEFTDGNLISNEEYLEKVKEEVQLKVKVKRGKK